MSGDRWLTRVQPLSRLNAPSGCHYYSFRVNFQSKVTEKECSVKSFMDGILAVTFPVKWRHMTVYDCIWGGLGQSQYLHVYFLQNLTAKRQFWFKTNFNVFRTSKKKSWSKFEEKKKLSCKIFETKKKFCGSGGIRTHASEETGALNQRLRPLGHATHCIWCWSK